LPGKYESQKRTIILNTELKQEPLLTLATLANRLVCDLLVQNGFAYAHLPELVDMAVVVTGLGALQNHINLVNNNGHFWDSTQWETYPRPFLDRHGLAYTHAVAAWLRNQRDPAFLDDLPADLKKPTKKSLKYLFRTGDCFVSSDRLPALSNHTNEEWIKAATEGSKSRKIIALRQLRPTDQPDARLAECILNRLKSGDRELCLHAIEAEEKLLIADASLIDELRMLTTSRDDQIKAKVIMTLTRLGALDDQNIEVAARMLDSRARFVVYAGIFALTSLSSVPEEIVEPANRGFVRSLQTCDYDMIGLFTSAWIRWEENPEQHFEALLKHDSPEYLELALESLANVREQMASANDETETVET